MSPDVLRSIGDLIAQGLQKEPGLAISTGRDLAAAMGLVAERQAAGCDVDSDACLAEIADALGASLVVTTNAARLDDLLVVTLSLYDVRQQASVARERIEARKLSSLPKHIDHAVGRMLGREAAPFVEQEPGPSPLVLGGGIVGGVGLLAAVGAGIGAGLAASTIGSTTSTGAAKDEAQDSFPLLAGGAVVGGVVAVVGVGLALTGLVIE